MDNNAPSSRTLTFWTATSLVIANMVGTGVFTSLGFQAQALSSSFAILALWILGGVIAMCGALCYGELGTTFPRSGGEYLYLSEIYHPFLGFLSGFVSGTVAFAAPMALAAMAFGRYASSVFPGLTPQALAAGALIIVSAIHLASADKGARFLNFSTLVKLVPIGLLILLGLGKAGAVSFLPTPEGARQVFTSGFAVSLVYVSYAYSGWNASTYLAGELRDPRRTLPGSVIMGCLAVTGLYVLLHIVFLSVIPFSELPGTLEVGFLCAKHLFGEGGQKAVSLFIAAGLVSTISSFVLAGSRVVKTIGEDFKSLGFLARQTPVGNPRTAISLQSGIALALLLTSSFDQVLTYIGFVLTVFTVLSVAGLFILRRRKAPGESVYKTWGYPVTPLLFIAFNLYMMFFLLTDKTKESVAGLATLAIGGLLYGVIRKKESHP